MSEHAAAVPLPSGSESTTSAREALLEAGRLTALGLAASLEIARAHGGDLIALSSVSAGASFVLRLPLTETAA